MKLLFYIPGLVDGGAERVMATLASQFALLEHDVTLAVDFPVKENSPPLHPLVSLIELENGHRATVKNLAILLHKERYDMAIAAIAANSFKLALASLLARLHDKVRPHAPSPATKIVLTYHGFEEYKTGTLSRLGMISLPLLSRLSARIVAVSDSLKDELEQRWKAKRQKLVRIYNPVFVPTAPTNFQLPQTALDLEKRQNLVLSAGRLVPGKRFDLLIRSFHRLADPKSRLVILGEGPERPKLTRLIEELGLSEHVELPGFVADTGRHYANAKCFVLTSQKESFGLVLVEALAYGLPVLSCNRGGPPELLEQGRHGSLLGNDPQEHEVARALHKVLEAPGDPAPRIAHAKSFDVETGIRHYNDLFNEIQLDRS